MRFTSQAQGEWLYEHQRRRRIHPPAPLPYECTERGQETTVESIPGLVDYVQNWTARNLSSVNQFIRRDPGTIPHHLQSEERLRPRCTSIGGKGKPSPRVVSSFSVPATQPQTPTSRRNYRIREPDAHRAFLASRPHRLARARNDVEEALPSPLPQ